MVVGFLLEKLVRGLFAAPLIAAGFLAQGARATSPSRTEERMAWIRHPKDFFAGLLFIAFGIAAIVIGLGEGADLGAVAVHSVVEGWRQMRSTLSL